MIPILYNKNFSGIYDNGLGGLPDCISCIVTEERNGAFELEVVYSADGVNFENIKCGNIIRAKPNRIDSDQAFRIYYISKPLNGRVTVKAEHISYALKYIPVLPFTANSVEECFEKLKANSCIENRFIFNTDYDIDAKFTLSQPKSCREILGGSEGSILQHFKGEYKFDNFNVYYSQSRGVERGLAFEYGVNITDMADETDVSDMVCGVLPYFKNDTSTVIGDIVLVENEQYEQFFSTEKAIVVDFSNDFQDSVPTKEMLEEKAKKYIEQNKLYEPKVNITVDVVALGDAIGYEAVKGFDNIGLCDTVAVCYDKLGINCSAKIIKTVYDVLSERYSELEIGNAKQYALTEMIKR